MTEETPTTGNHIADLASTTASRRKFLITSAAVGAGAAA